MSPSESDKVLVRLFGGAEAFPEPGDGSLFEVDQLSHADLLPRNGLISYLKRDASPSGGTNYSSSEATQTFLVRETLTVGPGTRRRFVSCL